MSWRELVGWFVALVIAFGGGYLLGCRERAEDEVVDVKTQRDTLYLRDTIVRYKAIAQRVTKRDTIRVACRDTIRERDTLYLALEREQLEWRDSLATIWASGVAVEVDSVRHYVSERVVNVTTEVVRRDNRTRWGIGISAGYAMTPRGGQPYVGIGVNYNLYNFKKRVKQ